MTFERLKRFAGTDFPDAYCLIAAGGDDLFAVRAERGGRGRAFVTEGLYVKEVTISERTLEEVFFEMTRSGVHAPAPNDLASSLEAVR